MQNADVWGLGRSGETVPHECTRAPKRLKKLTSHPNKFEIPQSK